MHTNIIILFNFYNLILFIVIIFVLILFVSISLNNTKYVNSTTKSSLYEYLDNLILGIPILVTVLIGYFMFLEDYSLINKLAYSRITIIGAQWYWIHNSESFYLKTNIINAFIEVETPISILYNNIKVIGTRSDVIHRIYVPYIGYKIDVIPGRLNRSNIELLANSNLYGLCREICGANHRFIPFILNNVSFNKS